jgi:hypothetical protein
MSWPAFYAAVSGACIALAVFALVELHRRREAVFLFVFATVHLMLAVTR